MLFAAVALVDFLLALVPRRRNVLVPERPRRVLLANWAHFGDVVLSLPALAALRRTYPDAELGFLGGSWARSVIDATGLGVRYHALDHWRISRREGSKWSRFRSYLAMRRQVIDELRACGYDLVIDLYQFFPTAAGVFSAAGIPCRIGFTSGGLGPLLTHPVAMDDQPRHVIDWHRDLLNLLPPLSPLRAGDLKPVYPGTQVVAATIEIPAAPYVLVHMGAGNPAKEWPIAYWRSIVTTLSARGIPCVLSGTGAREAVRIDTVLDACGPGMLRVVNAPWPSFVALVEGARAVICSDSVAGHIAACFEKPSVVIFSGTNSPAHWAPLNPAAEIVSHPVGCAPCNRSGCASMACVQEISPETVLAAFERVEMAASLALAVTPFA